MWLIFIIIFGVEQDKQNKVKSIQKKREELDQQLTNMLIHLYNGKKPDDYIKEYKIIIDHVSTPQLLLLV